MSGDPGWLCSGAAGSQNPLHLLVNTDGGGSHGGILRRGVSRLSGSDSGSPAVPNHFQCGGGRSGAPLGISGGGCRVSS